MKLSLQLMREGVIAVMTFLAKKTGSITMTHYCFGKDHLSWMRCDCDQFY